MREEVLQQLREEYNKKKQEVKIFNENVDRIRQLQQDPNVMEYMSLINSIGGIPRNLVFDEVQTVRGILNRLYYTTKEEDTNKIYVCLGTYHSHENKSDVYSICDDLVDYNSPDAHFRLYQDIEKSTYECIPIKECKKFENDNYGNIIFTNAYVSRMVHSKIHDDFVIESIKHGQEYAKKYVLGKYSERKN